jgi:integrase
MSIELLQRMSHDKKKIFYSLEWGKKAGQRIATGIFTFVTPVNALQKHFNKKAFVLVETKRLNLLLETFKAGTSINHKYSYNFLEFYRDYVARNKVLGNRHLECSFLHFKRFIKAKQLLPTEVTEELSFNFRRYLLEHLNGETPANYFARYKHMVKAAAKQGYLTVDPCQDIPIKANKNKARKNNLEVEEYLKLLCTPAFNEEIRDAFIFCCYTGLRWCDVKLLNWRSIKDESLIIVITQKKTSVEHFVTLHPIAKRILEKN